MRGMPAMYRPSPLSSQSSTQFFAHMSSITDQAVRESPRQRGIGFGEVSQDSYVNTTLRYPV